MKTFLVCFDCGDGIYSSNMIWANTGRKELEAVTDTAERRAARFGYKLVSVNELSDRMVESNSRRGMPLYPIDDEAEEKYDASMIDEINCLA